MRSSEDKMMQQATAITCVFLDIGGVLLTNGWDHHARQRAAPTVCGARPAEKQKARAERWRQILSVA